MEWKIIVGQICLTAFGIAALFCNYDGGLVYTLIGALSASIGIPAVLEATKRD